ncbi:MAG: DNA polymerase III subunit gamma/tau [Lachnospiraceae bacterium]|nr:DNA polymerase III subunit gamma/tau [Lachnospiraceae bacterium]
MAYIALYRKFRPQEFSEVKGQDHIVTTLKNQIKANRIGHAYLFTGTRGTGKTSVAKLFAKAVNCEHPKEDGSPCGECTVCKAVQDGSSLNVIEIDAASNTGVQNIRDIIDEVSYPPTEGKYKVYIIDEVHMLSQGAFNALLKTLEEPPSYVIFILATTEVQKVPITIKSRCQRYDFHRISIETISARLMELLEREGIEYEERAIRYVAKAGDGSMRDALSLLDQCIAFYIDQKLTYDNVLNVLGAVDTDVFQRLLRCITEKDVLGAVEIVEEIVIDGRELGQFVTDFVWYLRNLLLARNLDQMEDILDVSSENMAKLKEQADLIEDVLLMRYIRVLSDLSNQLKYSSQKRVLLEVTIIKLCKPQMEKNYDSLLDRMDTLERQLEKGVVVQNVVEPAGKPVEAQPVEVEKKSLPAAVPEDVKNAAAQWRSIIHDVDPMLTKFLKDALVSVSEQNELIIVFDVVDAVQSTAYNMVMRPENQEMVRKAINDRIGREVPVKFVDNATGTPKEKLYTDAVEAFTEHAENIGIEVEIEDF